MDIEDELSDKAQMESDMPSNELENLSQEGEDNENCQQENEEHEKDNKEIQDFPFNDFSSSLQEQPISFLNKKQSSHPTTSQQISSTCGYSTQLPEETNQLQTSNNLKAISLFRQNFKQNRRKSSTKFSISFIPKQIQRPFNLFNLKGSIFIDCNRYYDTRISNINYYFQLRSSSILRERQVLYVKYESDPKICDSFQLAIAYLRDFPNKDCNELAEKLADLEQFQAIDEKVKEQIKALAQTNPMVDKLLQTKKEEFKQTREQLIASLSKDRYYSYIDYSYDNHNMCYNFEGAGFNEISSRFMGCDLDSMQEIFIRKGILELAEAESRWRVINKLIDMTSHYYYGASEIRSEIIRIITLDNIQVDLTLVVQMFQSTENEFLKGYFHQDYEHHLFQTGFIITELLVTDFHVKQINAIREDRLTKKMPIEELDKDVFSDVIPIADESERIKGELESQGFLNSDINSCVFDNLKDNQYCLNTDLFQQNEYTLPDLEKIQNSLIGEYPPLEPLSLTKNPNGSLVKNLMIDIPYQAQTSYFMERFYGNKKPIPLPLQDRNPNKTCKYKSILR